MRNIAIFMAACLLSTPASAQLFICVPDDGGDLIGPSGVRFGANKPRYIDSMISSGVKFSFDSESGLFRTHYGSPSPPQKFRIVQRHNSGNDLYAIREHECLVSCPLSIIRIRPWETPIRFHIELTGAHYVGTCTY